MTEQPRAVFCSHLQPGKVVEYRHIGIHIENHNCIDPVGARELLKVDHICGHYIVREGDDGICIRKRHADDPDDHDIVTVGR